MAESLLECKATSTPTQLSTVESYFLNERFNPPVVLVFNQILFAVLLLGVVELIATSTPSKAKLVASVEILTQEPFVTFL